jgi:cysteine synthase A
MPRSDWTREAIRKIEADFNRSADTHLIPLDLPGYPDIRFYFKDESSHPTGSLKHRLARSLFLYALCNGWLREQSTIVEASSGSTDTSEAYFAGLLGLPFVAVIPAGTSRMKIEAIEFYGGRCHLVANPADIYAESHRLAAETGGHFWYQAQGIPVAQPDALIARAVAGEAVLTQQSIAGMKAAGAGI